MEFQKSVIELIKIRKSSRTYDEIKIKKSTEDKLINYMETLNNTTKIGARFVVTNDNSKEEEQKLGTYGVIKGAKTFIVGIMDKKEENAVEFGYLFEKIILFATDLGLQTCWMGGTFNKSQFRKTLNLAENEFIPIVSPIGIRKEKPRVFESTMRLAAGANKRKDWSELFFEESASNSLNKEHLGDYAVPLEMVRIGPSASNKQPWRIIKNGNQFQFFLCKTIGYGVMEYDIQRNDMGIAKCHFELSAIEKGLNGRWIVENPTNTFNEWEYIFTWLAE
ncbi:MAG TPA: nitroreductase family protein [Lachnospiraceae bacterium]|nr:nitroreductase family protein [Lachnospiraceae bacterium]